MLKNIPCWVYLLITGVLIVLFYLIFQKYIRKGRNHSNRSKPDPSSEPITIRNSVFKVIPGNAQHIGARSEQQDAFAFSDISDDQFIRQFGVLAVLADGMGGLSGGKEASRLAVNSFLDHYLHSSNTHSIPEKLVNSVKMANDAVLQFARENGLEGGVGTTLIAAVVLNNQLYCLSVGDSRIYLHQGEALTQLTTDHIYANELDEKAAFGEITMEEAENDPQRESLTSFLGLERLEELDVTMEPIQLYEGDSVILCSDGLYGSVTNHEMIDACRRLSAQEAAEELIEMALRKQKPNQDNATVALLTIRIC
nr:protein phosphatase 2C domain-containing protein [Bacillus sp. FJAT-29790]